MKLNEIIKLRKSFCFVSRPTDNKYLPSLILTSYSIFLDNDYKLNILFFELRFFKSEFPEPLEFVIIFI